jgi:hypothetical protein
MSSLFIRNVFLIRSTQHCSLPYNKAGESEWTVRALSGVKRTDEDEEGRDLGGGGAGAERFCLEVLEWRVHASSRRSFLQYQNCLSNSVALRSQANYTDWATATRRRNLVSTFVDRGVSCGQRGRSPMAVNLSFLDRSRYFSFM